MIKVKMGPIAKGAIAVTVGVYAVGAVRSGNPQRPDIPYAISLAQQGVKAGVEVGGKAIAGAAQFVPATEPAQANAAPTPIKPALPPTAPGLSVTPPAPVAANGQLKTALHCPAAIAPTVTPLGRELYRAWLARTGTYPRATLQDLQRASAPAACIFGQNDKFATWLVDLDGVAGRLTARFDRQWRYVEHQFMPLR